MTYYQLSLITYICTMELFFSFIIPVYNRPQEIKELLESMVAMQYGDPYEIVIVEDGSTETAVDIVEEYADIATISYYQKPNTGPGDSRNYGMKRALGNYYIILDSDVILPGNYLTEVNQFLKTHYVHCFGGPDGAHQDFSKLQKAISYSMTSYLTTGGIRGRAKTIGKFQPRSFNMGLSKEAFEASKGFGRIHPGEDPDLTIRLWGLGYETAFIPDAIVFHKRRISWRKFYIQVNKFGLVRPILNKWHPQTAKLTYWFPLVFMISVIFAILGMLFGYWHGMALIGSYFMLIFFGASIHYKDVTIGLRSVLAVFIQFYGYGRGFLTSYYYIHILKKEPEETFNTLFF